MSAVSNLKIKGGIKMAKKLPFTGSGVAIITPFDGYKTNYDAFGELI